MRLDISRTPSPNSRTLPRPMRGSHRRSCNLSTLAGFRRATRFRKQRRPRAKPLRWTTRFRSRTECSQKSSAPTTGNGTRATRSSAGLSICSRTLPRHTQRRRSPWPDAAYSTRRLLKATAFAHWIRYRSPPPWTPEPLSGQRHATTARSRSTGGRSTSIRPTRARIFSLASPSSSCSAGRMPWTSSRPP